MALPTRLSAATAVAIVLLTPSAATSGRTFRVGLVVGPGTSDSADTQLRQAFRRSVTRLGVQGRVVVLPPSLVATASLTDLARERYDLVITAPSVDAKYVSAAATRYPSERFLITLPSAALGHKLKNVQGVIYRSEEGARLAAETPLAPRRVKRSARGDRTPPLA